MEPLGLVPRVRALPLGAELAVPRLLALAVGRVEALPVPVGALALALAAALALIPAGFLAEDIVNQVVLGIH